MQTINQQSCTITGLLLVESSYYHFHYLLRHYAKQVG